MSRGVDVPHPFLSGLLPPLGTPAGDREEVLTCSIQWLCLRSIC